MFLHIKQNHTSLSLRMVGFCAEELIRSGEFSSVPPHFPLDVFFLRGGGYTVRFPILFKVIINGSDKWSKLFTDSYEGRTRSYLTAVRTAGFPE